MKGTFLSLALFGLISLASAVQGQDLTTDYFGRADNIPVDKKEKAPLNGLGGDVFGSEVYIEGRTDVSLDLLSIQAELQEKKRKEQEARKSKDLSIRKDIISGEPVTILIAPDHYTQITFLKDGEIVYPRRAYPAQPDLLIIEKQPNSPYLYVSSSVMLDGQTTNLFVETEEDGKVQTYVFNMKVTTPNNIREQVQVNLINDLTPPIRGGKGSEAERETQARSLLNLKPGSEGRSADPTLRLSSGNVHGKFNRDDIKTYFNTMIQMAESYGDAKKLEQETGKIVYRNQDITPYPGSKVTYIDPIEDTQWRVKEIWYFPRYDAVLLGVICNNPTSKTSMWDYSQVKWKVNGKNPPFDTTAASPTSMQTPPNRANAIWYLLQGYRVDPLAEYSPVFPKKERRGEPAPSQTQRKSPEELTK